MLWARADLRQRWTSSILLALLVAVPVGASLALVAGARRAGESVDRFVASTDLADVVVFLNGPATPPPEITHDPRIARIERTSTVAAAPSPITISELGFALVGGDAASPGGLGRPALLAGRYPAAGSTDEIMLNERGADIYGLTVGSRVPVRALESVEAFEHVELGEAEIVGIVRLPFDLIDDPSTQALMIAGPDFAAGMLPAGSTLGTIIWLHLRDPGQVADVVSDLSPLVADGDVEATRTLLDSGADAVRLQRNGLLIAGAIVALAGLLAVAQAVARHLAPRRDDADVLAAIGLTTADRRRAGLLAVGPGLLGGAVIGLFVTVLASRLLPLGLARRADPVRGFRGDWPVLVVGFAVVLVAVWLCAVVVVRRWVRPVQNDETDRPSPIARVAATLALRPVPTVGSNLALASGRGRARLPVVPTLAVLAATTAIVAGALAIRSSLDGLAADAERYGQPWDAFVDVDASEQRDAGERLAADPRVEGVEAMHSGEVDLGDDGGTVRQVAAIGLEGLTGPMWLAVLEGRAPADPGEIAVGTSTMRSLELAVGDQTTVSGPCGERRVDVVGRSIVPLIKGDDPDSGVVLPLSTFDELCAGRLIAGLDEQVGVIVRLHDDDGASFVTALAGKHWAVDLEPVPSSVSVLADVRQVPVLLGVAIALLWLLVCTHAMLLAVRRRGGDLAVLRALGMRPGDLRRVVTWQAIAMGVVTLGIGIPAGLILGRVTWSAIAGPANVLVRLDVAPLAFAAMALAAIALLVGAAIWPGRQASRLRPIDMVRSE